MKRLKLWLWWLWNGRDRLDMAWTRIEALERTNAKLAAEALAKYSALQAQIDILNSKLNNLQQETKTTPKQARNWREVQNFVGAGETHANG